MTSINKHDIFKKTNLTGELKLSFGKFPPPPFCFSCGNELPDSDFEYFHLILNKRIKKGEGSEYAQKITLDEDLSKPYPRLCCRVMFLGDNLDYRKYSALYIVNSLEINSQLEYGVGDQSTTVGDNSQNEQSTYFLEEEKRLILEEMDKLY